MLVSITETVFESKWATYRRVPSGVSAAPSGVVPVVATVAMTVLLDVSMTDTFPAPGIPNSLSAT